MNLIIEDIRRNVVAQASISTYIKSRFYPGSLASLKNPQYPCVNIEYDVGGVSDSDIPKYQSLPCSITAWTRSSLDEAFNIYEAVYNFLEKWNYRDSDRMFVMHETTRPVPLYDDIDKVFYVSGRWLIQAIKRN